MRSAQRISAVARVPVIEGHGLGSKARVGICFGVGPLLNLGPSLKADIAATANGVRKGPDRDFGPSVGPSRGKLTSGTVNYGLGPLTGRLTELKVLPLV